MKKGLLLKLAKHLESGTLGHKKFDFSILNLKRNGRQAEPYTCGYAGCAIGELPILFPNQWKFDDKGIPRLLDSDPFLLNPMGDAEEFFDLSDDEGCHLFVPGLQMTDRFGGKLALHNATRYDVASNIRAFIKKMS